MRFLHKDGTNKIKKDWNDSFILRVITILFAAGVSFFGAMLYGLEEPQLIRCIIMCTLGCIIAIFSIDQYHSIKGDSLWGDFSFVRFMICFMVSFISAMMFPTVTSSIWPFLSVYVLLSLFSNTISGIVSGSTCLLLSILLHGNTDSGIFYLYFVSGVFGAVIFSHITDEFKITVPLLLSEITLFVCLMTNIVLMQSDLLEPAMFLMPCINLLINLVILFIILKAYSSLIMHRYREKFTDLADPECDLMKRLREKSEKEYYHSIHVSYFCDRISRKIGLDETAVKAAGYYHHIGILYGDNNIENVQRVSEEYAFPPALDKILSEYMTRGSDVMSRESLTLLFSEWVVSSMEYLFAKEGKTEIKYESVIRSIFNKKFSNPAMWNSSMSLKEVNDMQQVFIDEKLYYDIMRT